MTKANGKHSGSNKSQRKKRAYKAHCRAQILSGKINNYNGDWVTADHAKGSGRAVYYGTLGKRGGGGRRRRVTTPSTKVE